MCSRSTEKAPYIISPSEDHRPWARLVWRAASLILEGRKVESDHLTSSVAILATSFQV